MLCFYIVYLNIIFSSLVLYDCEKTHTDYSHAAHIAVVLRMRPRNLIRRFNHPDRPEVWLGFALVRDEGLREDRQHQTIQETYLYIPYKR